MPSAMLAVVIANKEDLKLALGARRKSKKEKKANTRRRKTFDQPMLKSNKLLLRGRYKIIF